MKNKITACILALMMSVTVYASTTDDVKSVESTMKAMTDSWNHGDLNAYLNYYKHADVSTYVSSKIINGYKNIAQRYEDDYPANDVMGKLSISHLKVKMLSPTYAMTIGNWRQVRDDTGTKEGTFSLLWEKTNDGWKIIVDHTS